MTNDEKKKRLSIYIHANKKVDDLEDEIEHLKAKAEKTTPTLSDMPKGSECSDKTKIIDTYLGMINDLEIEVIKLKEAKRQVEYLISTIDDWKVERVMRMRYVRGFQWEEICYRTSYCWTQVHKHHSDGLNSIEFSKRTNGNELNNYDMVKL